MAQWAHPREELFSTVLLAIATLLSGWSSYQSAKWSGDYKLAYAASVRQQVAAAQADNLGLSQRSLDVALFVEWLGAVDRERNTPGLERGQLSGFLEARFRDEMRPAMNAWLAQQPLENPEAPPSPFSLPEYRLAALTRAAELGAEAEQSVARALDSHHQADSFLATSVSFSVVLFFAAIGTKVHRRRYRWLSLGSAAVFLVVSAGIMATLPVAPGQ